MPYITPSATPTESRCRRLSVPNDTRSIAALYGQLFELTEVQNWEQTDGITAQASADIWTEVWDNFRLGAFCMIGAVVPILHDVLPNEMLLCIARMAEI